MAKKDIVKHQFKKGESGNPDGRPKGSVSLVTKMREALDKIHDGTQEPYHELLVQSMMKDAIKADGQSRRLFLQYLEGMPYQPPFIDARVENKIQLTDEQFERIITRRREQLTSPESSK